MTYKIKDIKLAEGQIRIPIPELYSSNSLKDIIEQLQKQAKQLGHQLEHFQSNAEHELIAQVHQAPAKSIDMIILNAGALTHTSIALRDALAGVNIAFIEVHISNIYAREEFRHISYLADIAIGTITGFGAESYFLALRAADYYLQSV